MEEFPERINQHWGDCSIYAAMVGPYSPDAGICTCGYGRQFIPNNPAKAYKPGVYFSLERLEHMKTEARPTPPTAPLKCPKCDGAEITPDDLSAIEVLNVLERFGPQYGWSRGPYPPPSTEAKEEFTEAALRVFLRDHPKFASTPRGEACWIIARDIFEKFTPQPTAYHVKGGKVFAVRGKGRTEEEIAALIIPLFNQTNITASCMDAGMSKEDYKEAVEIIAKALAEEGNQ